MIYLKVDANSKIGGGHLSRCKIIAQELERRGEKYQFIFQTTPQNIIDNSRIREDQYLLLEELELDFLDLLEPKSLLIIDSDVTKYASKEFQESCREREIRTLLMTVNDTIPYYCDLLLNPNILAFGQEYNVSKETKTLFGPHYFVLQDKFRGGDFKPKKKRESALEALVCFGGADPNNVTLEVVEALEYLKPDTLGKVTVIVGGMNPHWDQISKKIESITSFETELLRNVSNIEHYMERADFGVISCGLTFWEMATMHRPAFCIAASEREKESAVYLEKLGYTQTLGSYDQIMEKSEIAHKIEQSLINGLENTIFVHELNEKINPDGVVAVVNEMLTALN